MTDETKIEGGAGDSRRGFLAMGGALAAALLAGGAASPARAEEPAASDSDLEKANLKVVQDFCDAWALKDGAKLGEFLAEDAKFKMSDAAPIAEGRETIAKRFQVFLASAKTARFDVVQAHAIGPIVINERHDRFQMAQKETDYHMVGVFWVKDGKIQQWLDFNMPKA